MDRPSGPVSYYNKAPKGIKPDYYNLIPKLKKLTKFEWSCPVLAVINSFFD